MEKQKGGIIGYTWRTRRTVLTIMLIGVFLFFAVVLTGYNESIKTTWDNYGDWLVAIVTLFIAGAVFCGEIQEDYKKSLPKRLTVHFVYKAVEVMRCEGAVLSSESDIRALSQQIGRQMVKKDIQFPPMLGDFNSPYQDGHEMLYTTTIVLTSLPTELETLHRDNKILLWLSPFTSAPNAVNRSEQS